jgi:prophage antirepressor-like protein
MPINRSSTMDTHAPGASAPVQAVVPAIFQFHSTEVRTIDRDGQVWFVADDIAKALGYRESRDMTRVLDEDEAAPHTMRIRSENGTLQTCEVTILSESGLYHALLKSRKPEAQAFRKWVTAEVLPAIRRSGCFSDTATQIPNLLQHGRFLLTFDSEGRPQTTPLPHNASILSATDKISMTTLMREYIPGEMLPDLMRIGLDRLARMAERGRNHPVRPNPINKEVKP